MASLPSNLAIQYRQSPQVMPGMLSRLTTDNGNSSIHAGVPAISVVKANHTVGISMPQCLPCQTKSSASVTSQRTSPNSSAPMAASPAGKNTSSATPVANAFKSITSQAKKAYPKLHSFPSTSNFPSRLLHMQALQSASNSRASASIGIPFVMEREKISYISSKSMGLMGERVILFRLIVMAFSGGRM